MKVVHALFLLFISMATLPAQAQASFGPFISNASKHPSVISYDKQLLYLSGKPYSLSPFQKIELRTESNQLDPARQDYAVRVNPANPWEIRQQNQYFKELGASLQVEKSLAFKEELSLRYQIIVNLVVAKEFMDMAKKELELVRSYTSTLEKQHLSSSFDADDYLELTLEEMEKTVAYEERVFEYEKMIQKASASFTELSAAVHQWNLHEMITLEQIQMMVDSSVQPIGSTAALYYQSKIGLAEREYALEKTNRNIGYLQTQYQPFRIEQGRKPWSIGLGLALPIANPNKGDMAKRKLDIIESEHELMEAELEIANEQQKKITELRSLLSRYQSIHEKIQSLHTSRLSSTVSLLKDSNPVSGLRFQYNLFKLELLKIKLWQSTLLIYIEWLESTDALQQTPLTNYLSKHLETLSSE